MFTFNTLQHVPVKTISDTFNAAFADYLIPFQLTEAQLSAKIRNEDIRPDLSAGVFDKNRLVGFILNAYNPEKNGAVVYNGGTGIIPDYRGNRLTRQLYEFIIPRLKQAQAVSTILEVMAGNHPALHSYQRTGFNIIRELAYFKGNIMAREKAGGIQISELVDFDWNRMRSFWSIEPSWQSKPAFVENVRQGRRLDSYGAYRNKELKGYIIYNPESKRILQLAVHPGSRRAGIGTQLINYIYHLYAHELAIGNVDVISEETIIFFQRLGMSRLLTQYEMELAL